MKKMAVVLFLLAGMGGFAQQGSAPQKYALVIGNADYVGVAKLKNPANDANDMAATLQGLGFTVDKVIDGSLDDMEKAIIRLKNRLSVSKNAYGFFFYAGHGVQSNGMNYLIPVGANISGENYLRERAVSVQTMLAELNDAGNDLNVIVLDACRDNPFEWARGGRGGGSRGLSVVSNQPADSILVYATSAGSIAADGEGRNGLFTAQLLKNLKTPGLEVNELFHITGADVSQASGRRQIPAIYNQFFGKAYLGTKPVETATPVPVRPVQPARPARPAQPVQPEPVQPVQPAQPVQPPNEPEDEGDKAAAKAGRLWTLGVSAGTTFAAPLFAATIDGTIAPFRGQFFNIGVELGFSSVHTDVNYFSVYPFVRSAFFLPYKSSGGWYVGGGAGIMLATSQKQEEEFKDEIFALDIFTGAIILNVFNISYSLRTNFTSAFMSANHKLSVGVVKRF